MFLPLFSCRKSNETADFLGKHKIILAFPLKGCGQCVDKALDWAKANFSNQNIGFVIVGSYRDKAVKSAFGSNLYNLTNVNFDTSGYCIRNRILDTQPIFRIIQENGEVEVLSLNDNNFDLKANQIMEILTEEKQ